MRRPRHFAALIALLIATSATWSVAESDGLAEQATFCDKSIAGIREDVESTTLWSNIFMVSGAVVSATGCALAAFLSRARQRKVAAVVGALGAVITILPKALPDANTLQMRLVSAERHRLLGSKIRNQLQFAGANESTVEAKKYASARFTDCASLDPPTSAPDLPRASAPKADDAVSLGASNPAVAPQQEFQGGAEPGPNPANAPAPAKPGPAPTPVAEFRPMPFPSIPIPNIPMPSLPPGSKPPSPQGGP